MTIPYFIERWFFCDRAYEIDILSIGESEKAWLLVIHPVIFRDNYASRSRFGLCWVTQIIGVHAIAPAADANFQGRL